MGRLLDFIKALFKGTIPEKSYNEKDGIEEKKEYCMLATENQRIIDEILNNPNITILEISKKKNGDTFLLYTE